MSARSYALIQRKPPTLPTIVHVDRRWTEVEEGHFTWGQQGPLSTPDNEMGSVSEVEDEGKIDNIAECVVGPRKDTENEAGNEAGASPPLRRRKRPQWWACG